jgi:hypothetical protein
MKTKIFGAFVLITALAGCSTIQVTPSSGSETVMVTYHVRAGKEADFQAVLARGWQTYQSEKMVYPKPHIVVQNAEGDGKNQFVEIMTWIHAPDHAPESVKPIWTEEHSLCEARDGRSDIEFSVVQIVTGK